MTNPATDANRPPPADSLAVRVVVALASIPVGGIVCFLVGVGGAIGSYPCYAGSPDFKCTDIGAFLALSPWLGGLLLAVGCVTLAIVARLWTSRVWWVSFGVLWGVVIVTLILAAVVDASDG